MSDPIRLTQYSHGAGCGCKISPKVLDEMLAVGQPGPAFERLWVGNDSRDDAAVFGLDAEQGIVKHFLDENLRNAWRTHVPSRAPLRAARHPLRA